MCFMPVQTGRAFAAVEHVDADYGAGAGRLRELMPPSPGTMNSECYEVFVRVIVRNLEDIFMRIGLAAERDIVGAEVQNLVSLVATSIFVEFLIVIGRHKTRSI
jgi:hypothetical protein